MENSNNNNLSISVNFTSIECECGNIDSYNEVTCTKCGLLLSKDEFETDPCVKLRKEILNPVFLSINAQDERIKKLRKDINKNLVVKDFTDDFFELIAQTSETISNLMDSNSLNVSLLSEDLVKANIDDVINGVNEYFTTLYNLYAKLLSSQVAMLWINSLNTFTKAVSSYLKAVKSLLVAACSSTLREANENQTTAQKELDFASQEIFLFCDYLNLRKIEINHDIFNEGHINYSVIMSMNLCHPSGNDFAQNVKNHLTAIHHYFNQYLSYPVQHYKPEILLRISPYRLMGMLSFRENRYLEKIGIVVKILDESYKRNSSGLNDFLNIFKDKYVYACNKELELAEEFAFVFSYNATDKVIIKNAIGWYKDLSEGIYRDIASVLINSAYILDNKTIDHEDLLNGMGFPDKLNYLQQKTKWRLNVLTEGVEKVIRHSEAHVDYDICDNEKKIVFRNRIKDKDTTDTREYSYEEFMNLEMTLAETVYSIIAGLNIFLANNYEWADEFLTDTDNKLEESVSHNLTEFMFPYYGVIITSHEVLTLDGFRVLMLKGTSLEKTDKDFLKSLLSCFATVPISDPDVDIVQIEVEDYNNFCIGTVLSYAKYIKKYHDSKKDYRLYISLLILFTSEIKYKYIEDAVNEDTDIFGTVFVSSLLKLCFHVFTEIADLEKPLVYNFQSNHSKLNLIRDELMYVNEIIEEYKPFVQDQRLLNHISRIICDFVRNINFILNRKNHLLKTLNTSYQNFGIGMGQIGEMLAILSSDGDINEILDKNIEIV
jgi:hypothetical protein